MPAAARQAAPAAGAPEDFGGGWWSRATSMAKLTMRMARYLGLGFGIPPLGLRAYHKKENLPQERGRTWQTDGTEAATTHYVPVRPKDYVRTTKRSESKAHRYVRLAVKLEVASSPSKVVMARSRSPDTTQPTAGGGAAAAGRRLLLKGGLSVLVAILEHCCLQAADCCLLQCAPAAQ